MTIGKVMGVTTYATVMNVADSDITSVMSVAQGGGGGTALIEGFESVIGNLPQQQTWSDDSFGTPVAAASLLHVTEGTFSMLTSVPDFDSGYDISTTVDLTGKNTVEIDLYMQDFDIDNDSMQIFMTNVGSVNFDTWFPSGSIGAETIPMDITSWSGKNAITINIAIYPGSTTPINVYLDNLRAS
jgi:hypothetical protein